MGDASDVEHLLKMMALEKSTVARAKWLYWVAGVLLTMATSAGASVWAVRGAFDAFLHEQKEHADHLSAHDVDVKDLRAAVKQLTENQQTSAIQTEANRVCCAFLQGSAIALKRPGH